MSMTVQTADVGSASLATSRLPISDYCQTLFGRLGLGTDDSAQAIRTLGLTSCSRGEGVTTVAAQFATTAARSLGLPVALVDCNLANPALHRAFQIPIGPGLRDALWETAPVRDFLRPSVVPNLSLLTAGEPKHGAALAFGSPNFGRLLQELNSEFGLVIVDLPVFSQGVPAGVGALLDGLVLVLEAEKVRWEVAQRTTASLSAAGVDLLGVVMNKRRYHVPDWLYRTL